jgi:metal-responsive CopG/Arc/MetJ family transcriptional regulator
MNQNFLRTSVAFSEPRARQIDQLCVERGTTRAAFIRDAVIKVLDDKTDSARVALTTEFSQVALDVLIDQHAPDRRADILATVQQRLEKYHGG